MLNTTLMSYLTVTLTARGREPHNLELLPCTVTGSSLFAHAILGSPEILRGYINNVVFINVSLLFQFWQQQRLPI